MSSVRKRLLIIGMICIMLAVAVATVCIFTVPRGGNGGITDGGGAALAPSATADYTIPKVTYNSANSAYVYGHINDDTSLHVFMRYPKAIYLDRNKNETLSSAGYYFQFYGKMNGNPMYIILPHAAYGDWVGTTGTTNQSATTDMGQYFNSYSGSVSSTSNIYNRINENDNWSYNNVGYRVHYYQVNSSSASFSVQVDLQGTPKESINGTTLTLNPGLWFAFKKNSGWSQSTPNMNVFASSVASGNTAPFTSDSENRVGKSVDIKIYAYDASSLVTAIDNLQAYIDNSHIKSIATADTISSAQTKINEAKTLLTTREKTQSDINTKVNELNNFTFNTKTINFIKDIHTGFGERTFAENIAATIEGNDKSIDVYEFFNVDYTYSSGGYTSLNADNFPYGDWTEKDFYLPKGDYSFKFSAKSSSGVPITAAGSEHKFNVVSKMHVETLNNGSYNNNTNGQGINVWCYIDAPSNQTMSLASNTFTYNGRDKVIGGQYTDVDTGIISPTNFPEFAGKMGENYRYQYSIDGGSTWLDRVTLNDAGTYTINYRIFNELSTGLNKNEVQLSGSIGGGVSISKANIKLTISKKTVPYGGDLPDQSTFLGMVTDASDLYNLAGVTGSMTIAQLREKLGSMIELGLSDFDMATSTNNYAKSYTMNVNSYKNMEGRSKSWGDNVVVSFNNNSNQNCYIVDTIKINLHWTGGVTSTYDGQGGKRPTAVIQNIAAPLKQSDIIDAGVTAIEGSADGQTPELSGSTAVNYGRYVASVRLRDYSADDPDSAYLQNYTISNPTCEFGISKREITVEIKATSAVYGSEEANAMISKAVDLGNNLDSKISVTRGSIVDGQSASSVFILSIDKTGRGGSAGQPEGGAYLNAGAYDISGTCINDNYSVNFMGSTGNGSSNPAKSTFTVRKATMNIDMAQIASKRYNGQEQAVSIPVRDLEAFFQYNTTYDLESNVITYSLESAEGFNETLSVKHVNMNGSEVAPYVIYYRVSSDNYEDFGFDGSKSFNFTVTRLPIEVDIQVSSGIKYGNSGTRDAYGYPTSAEIKEACLSGDHGYFVTSEDGSSRSEIDLSGTMEFYLSNATEGQKLQVGSYTVSHRVKSGADDRATNYNFVYNGPQTAQYVVDKSDLRFEWTVSNADEWGLNGSKPTYVYDDTSADKMLTASGATSGGKITIVPVAEDVYYGDVIEPQVELRNGGEGSETAYTRNVGDKVVYAHLKIGGGNIANYNLTTQWFEFEIVQRSVKVKLKGATYTYGTLSSASSSETGLGELSKAQKRWEYAADSDYTFVSESHHRAYGTFTPAKSTTAGQYVDVGRYPLYAGPLYAGETEYDVIYGNYKVEFTGSWSATDGPNGDGEFNGVNYVGKADIIEITKATITRTIPLESEQIVYNGSAHTIEAQLFKTRLSNPTNNLILNSTANAANLEVWFSDILASTTAIGNHEPISEGLPSADESDSRWTHKDGSSPEMTEVGTYDMAVWIRNVKNYRDLVMGVYVQITPSSIVITLNGTINAVYGNALYSTEELKTKVSELVVSIKETGDSATTYDNAVLKDWIKRFEIVAANGANMTSINDNVGYYSIRIAERNTVAEGFTLQFVTNGGLQNANIVGAYHVNPRPLEISWEDWSFTYGDHTHSEMVINKVSEDDEIYIDMERDVSITNSDGSTTGVYNRHARDKGTYKAEIMSISGANGTGANESMRKYTLEGMDESSKVKTITVEAREITVKLKAQGEHVYGELITVIRALEEYLYQTPSTYEIVSGTLANNAAMGINDNNNVKDVIRIKLSDNLSTVYGNEYISVGVYDIIGEANTEANGGNYEITFVGESGSELTDGKYEGGFKVNSAEIRASRDSKELIIYDGKEHDVIIRELGFILQGDGAVADESIGDGKLEDGVKNKLGYTISYMQTTLESNTKPSVDDSGWTSGWKVKNAGDYYNYIKVTADNHNPFIWKVRQTVARVDMLIKVGSTSVTYGEEVPDSDELYNRLSPEYKLSYDGRAVTVEGFETVLSFKVVGQGGDSELSGKLNADKYRVVCYATDGSSNYNITYADLADGSNKCNAEAFVVNKKQLSVTREEFDYAGTAWQDKTTQEVIGGNTVTVYSYVYDGKVPEIVVSAEGAIAGDSVSIVKTITRLDKRGERVDENACVGLYALELSVTAGDSRIASNYEIPQEQTLYYQIEKRLVEIEIGDRTSALAPIGDRERTYGVYKGNIPEGADSLVHQHNASDESKKFLSADGRPVKVVVDYTFKEGEEYIPVGEYEFKAECTNDNYEIKVVESHKYIVHNATARAHRDMYNTSYNGAPLNVDITAWLSGNNDNGEAMLELAGDVSIKDVKAKYKVGGIYQDRMEIDGITGEQAVTVEYKLSAPNHNDLEYRIRVNISRAKLVIGMNSSVRVTYGENVLTSDELYSEAGIYTNSDLAVDLRDIMTFKVSNGGIAAGRYNIGYEFKAGVNADWYVVEFAGKCNENAYTVQQKGISVVWSEEELIYNGSEQAPSVSLSGVLATDTCVATVEGVKGVDAGNYTIEVSSVSNSNYVITGNASKTYTIKQREATLEWSGTSYVFNGEERLPVATVSNLAKPTDECEVTVSGAKSEAGRWQAIAEELSNGNYKLSSELAKKSTEYVIEQATLGVDWEREVSSFEYSGEVQRPIAVLKGEMYGEDCKPVIEISKKEGGAGNAIDAGEYRISVKGVSNGNFKLANLLEKDFEIEKKEISFEWQVGGLVYTGEEQLPAYRANGIVAGEEVNDVFELSGGATNAGNNYTAVATLKSDNYVVSNGVEKDGKVIVTSVYEIGKANNVLKVEYDRVDWASGEKPTIETMPEASFGGVTIKYYTDEALTKEYTGTFDENTPDGKYWVEVTTESSDNYIGTTTVYSFEVKTGTKVEVYVIGIAATVAMLGAGLIISKTTRKKRV